jgi:branched-chain amino acid aminotransferase
MHRLPGRKRTGTVKNINHMIAFANDTFIEEEKATLRINDLAIQRGYAVFDFFRVKNNKPLFLNDYLDRFFSSARHLRLTPVLPREELTGIIHELINRNNLSTSGIRMVLTGGYSPDSFEPATPNLVITQQKISLVTPEKFSKGLKVITHEYMRMMPEIKSINYLMGIWLLDQIKEKGAEDVLFHHNGIVSEFPRSNVFIVTHDDVVVTPSDNILQGITRMKLLWVAAKKYRVEERDITLEELKNAAEVFMTSTTKRVLPITQIDDTLIGNGSAGKISFILNEDFRKMEDELVGLSTSS